ncbi:retrovirus-related pol polyprotein from transposon TNT 1-94 [Tanacetum coccineum]|uniref:Retrovirus-related pol polyprotein from transposon TNT 1-94 n=1 Tax=Tanacetum coccineum TaxID=301880 RepID=A0ABQ5IIB3_9ASTR
MDSVRKPRVKWEVERDENSKFFHGLINSRRKSQTVQGIMLDGVWNFEPKDIKSAFLDFYKDKFNYHDSPVSFPPMLPAHHLSINDHDFLESMVSMDEIKAAVWDYGIQSFMVFFSTGTMAGVDIDTLTMEQYLALSRENQASGVVKPEIGGNINFEIKSKFMRQLREDTFSGNKDEDAHDHIDRVLNIVDKLAPGTINTWDLLKKAFIQRYCPPSMTVKQLKDIHNFKQEGYKSLYQSWERYNDLLYKCPTHDINSHQKGPIPGMTPAQALTTIQTMADHSQKWHDGTTSRNIGRSCSNDGLAALVRCQFCEGPYLDKDCPLNEEVKQIKEVKYGEFGQTMTHLLRRISSSRALGKFRVVASNNAHSIILEGNMDKGFRKMTYPPLLPEMEEEVLRNDRRGISETKCAKWQSILPPGRSSAAQQSPVPPGRGSADFSKLMLGGQGAEPPKPQKVQKKSESAISSEESPLKKKPGTLWKEKKNSLSEVAQLKEAIKRSKQETHASHVSGSGDETDIESGVLDEQYRKTSGTDEGTVTRDDDDDEDNSGNDDGNNDVGDDNDEHAEEEEEEYTDERVHTPSYYELTDEEKIDDEEKLDEEEDDEVTKELYKDVNVNLEEDAHVTLTAVHDTQKTDGATQSSSVSSHFTSKLLNLDNPSLTDTTIASFMDTTVRHEEPSSQTSAQYTVPVTAVPEITSVFTITQVDQYAQALSSIPAIVDCYIDNKLEEAIIFFEGPFQKEVKTQLPRILPQAVSDYATPVIEKNITGSLKVAVLEKSSSQPQSLYEAVATLFEFELTKILIDKMKKNKSYDKANYKRELYETDKDLFDTYGEVFSLKRSRDDRDKDQDPSAGSKRGRLPLSSICTSGHVFLCHAEEPSHTVEDSRVQQNQEFDTGYTNEQPADKEASKSDWFKKLERPPTPDPDWNKRQHVDFRPPQTWINQVARAEEPPTSFDELMDTSFDFSDFVLNRLNIKDLTQEILATTEQLDWHKPGGKPYPFDLRKPLPLIPDRRGRQIIPHDFFINNDLESIKGGDLSRRYSTSLTKTKAATYEIK